MEQISSVQQMQTIAQAWHTAGLKIAFVPTMGNLHAGHLSLVEAAQRLADRVVVSIFVNPLQFGPQEDFASYPRTLDADADKLSTAGVDVLFTPSPEEIYPAGVTTAGYEVDELASVLEGAYRPGHFQGVVTVVQRLFEIVSPDIAIFGQKDFQQLQIIRRMVQDLQLGVGIVAMPTWREPSGLAMSSRNGYLSGSEREQAATIYQTLLWVGQQISHGARDWAALESSAAEQLNQAGFVTDYVAIRDSDSLHAPKDSTKDLVILAAAHLGKTRLIDNIHIKI